MPELPEVETAVRSLNKTILGRKIEDVWSDCKKLIKKPGEFHRFERDIKDKKIEEITRKGKNIIFRLSDGYYLIVHQKMTGHFLFGEWRLEKGKWQPLNPQSPFGESTNSFIHLAFRLDDGKMLAFSDLRKFAKVMLVTKKDFLNLEDLKKIGPDPLSKDFTGEEFNEIIRTQKGKIKRVLMNQEVISGIGNIYSDEILWESRIHPLSSIKKLSDEDIKKIHRAIRKVLEKAIILKGDSVSDYRLITGEKGGYQKVQKAYGRTGQPCFRRDGGKIERVKIGSRSAHFCPKCQK